MSNYVQVHYKNYSGVSEISHNTRKQREPKHLLREVDRLPNVLNEKTEQSYNELLKKAKKQSPRSWRSTSKPNVDAVISWSAEQVHANIDRYGIEKYNELVAERLEAWGKDIEETYGLTFVGFNLHNDEGHYDKEGNVILNQHAHVTLLDFNFKTGKKVLRTMKRSDFSNWQSLCNKHFGDLGFTKGNQSELVHKDSQEYRATKEEAEREINQELTELENDIEGYSLDELSELKKRFKGDKLKKRVIDYAYRLKKLEANEDDYEQRQKNAERLFSALDKIYSGEGELDLEEAEILDAIASEIKTKYPYGTSKKIERAKRNNQR